MPVIDACDGELGKRLTESYSVARGNSAPWSACASTTLDPGSVLNLAVYAKEKLYHSTRQYLHVSRA